MDKKNNLKKLLADRMQQCRIKQTEVAKQLNVTQAKVSMFLKPDSETTMRANELNRLFDILGIKTYLYNNRSELAKTVARELRNKKYASGDVASLTKEQMAIMAKDETITLFFDVQDEETLQQMQDSNVIDIENTYAYFNSLVRFYMLAGDNPTPTTCNNAVIKLGEEVQQSKGERTDNEPIVDTLQKAFGLAAGTAAIASALFSAVLPMCAEAVIAILLAGGIKTPRRG